MRVSEQDVERLAARLGEDAAARLDVERVAAGVADRLARSGGPVVRRPVGRWLAAAAAVALVTGAAYVTFGTDGAGPSAGGPVAMNPSLFDLSATELHSVLDSLEPPVPLVVTAGPSLDDLDAEQLETLLALMEG